MADTVGFQDRLTEIVLEYVRVARSELAERWKAWPIDVSQPQVYEVVGGLVARQVTLATQLALAPQTWNGHLAPLVLRSMTDVHITLAWILKDPGPRSERYVKYGLGQKKLNLEHFKADLKSRGVQDVDNHPTVKAMEASLNAERFHFLTEVSVGSWSETDTRTMASEADCDSLYRFAYTPFSAAVHSMWHHVAKYNLTPCQNPLHTYHRSPIDPDQPIDPDYMYRAAKYLDKTLLLFDEATQVAVPPPQSLDTLAAALKAFSDSVPSEHTSAGDVAAEI